MDTLNLTEYRQERKHRIHGLLGGVCAHCGTTEHLEVDHKDPKTQSFRLAGSDGTGGWNSSWEAMLEEIKKCQLLCKPCHIQKTIEERGFNSRETHGTEVSYRRRKCRCDECRAAHAAMMREYRHRKRQQSAWSQTVAALP